MAHNVNLNGNYANSIAMRELSANLGHFTHQIKSADLADFVTAGTDTPCLFMTHPNEKIFDWKIALSTGILCIFFVLSSNQ
jgi:hypothetical protein